MFAPIFLISLEAHCGALENQINSSIQRLNTISSPKNSCSTKAPSACGEIEAAKEEIDAVVGNKVEIDRKYHSTVRACLDEKFNSCYPNLKPSIQLSKIKQMFQSFKADPRFRYPAGGGGMCAHRAESLALLLAEEGYSATSIRITHSPTLIAMDRDVSGALNGNFDDYKGYHSLIQVLVDVNGKKVPYLLDPQYMEEPMTVDEYFIKTTGQVCNKTSATATIPDYTQCYYFEQKQNTTTEQNISAKINLKDPYIACGWASGKNILEWHDLGKGPSGKKDNLLNQTNGQIPEKFKTQVATERSSKELILNAYENYENKLKQDLKQRQYSLSQPAFPGFPSDYHAKLEQESKALEHSLTKYTETLRRVRKNLESK